MFGGGIAGSHLSADLPEIPDQDGINILSTARDCEIPFTRPLEMEDLAGGEMGHGYWRPACNCLPPDIVYAAYVVDESNRTAIRCPSKGQMKGGCRQLESFGRRASFEWNDCQTHWLILLRTKITGNPLSIRRNGGKIGVVIRQPGGGSTLA